MGVLTIVISILLATVMTGRLFLPGIMAWFVNRKLNLAGYRGSCKRIWVRLFSGTIVGYDLTFAPQTDLSIVVASSVNIHIPVVIVGFSWRALFHKKLDLTVTIKRPTFDIQHHTNLTPESLEQQYALMRNIVSRSMHFILHAEIDNGRITYSNTRLPSGAPLVLSTLNAKLSNFSNDRMNASTATLTWDAHVWNGLLQGNVRSVTLAARPTFLASVILRNGKMTCLNPLLRKFLKTDVHSGTFNVRTELVADQGTIEGYVEPLVWDITMHEPSDKSRKPGQMLREFLLTVAVNLLGSGKRNEISVRVPLTGTLNTLHVSFSTMIPPILGQIVRRVTLTR